MAGPGRATGRATGRAGHKADDVEAAVVRSGRGSIPRPTVLFQRYIEARLAPLDWRLSTERPLNRPWQGPGKSPPRRPGEGPDLPVVAMVWRATRQRLNLFLAAHTILTCSFEAAANC